VLGAVLVCLAAPWARAQEIALVDDGHGHRVYVNVNTPQAQPSHSRRRSLREASPPPEIEKLVNQAAKRHQVDPKLVRAVIQVESDYDPGAVSSKGAMGLMQLMPATAERFGVQNPFNAKQNIDAGANYLKYLLDLFNGDLNLSLAAYNSGEKRVMRRGGVPAIPETVNYVRKVKSLYDPGGNSTALAAKAKTPMPVTIYRYVDASGVVHYTDGGDL
jgi:Transglycosylase SLT domain/Domain of unknown function (DUF4124)